MLGGPGLQLLAAADNACTDDEIGSLAANFNNGPAGGSLEVAQHDIHAQCIRTNQFAPGGESMAAGVERNSCQGKGKSVDPGVPIDYGSDLRYQEGYQAGFSDSLNQGTYLGYRAGWKKGVMTGYDFDTEAVEEGNAQLIAF